MADLEPYRRRDFAGALAAIALWPWIRG